MARKTGLILLLGIIVSFLALPAVYGKTEDDIPVSCYAGDPSDNRWVGEVAVFNVNKARGNCNILYEECEGDCTPCYVDEDSREVCIDRSGNPYFR
ncbi:MAG: hypothetical protein A4E65_01210 [Syntrophorhabdus sp. PtaU1.Bin153]|nr:MAG: hypothetical protein A4E65_01210 [Syntrophorhabdus sp. PtaU1.Bin153]